MFGVRTVIADAGTEFPQESNRFLMQVFFEQGYSSKSLLRLNRVHVYWQALFLSDILTASGKKIDTEIIGQPQVCRKQSRLRWPTEHPTEWISSCGGMQLWPYAQVGTLGQDWACPLRQRTGYGTGDGMRVRDACANLAKTERQRKCFGRRRNQTGSTIRRHGQPRDKGSSAQWSPHTRGRSGEDGD